MAGTDAEMRGAGADGAANERGSLP